MNSKIEIKGFNKILEDKKFILSCYKEMLTNIGENEIINLLSIEDSYNNKNIINRVSDEKIIQSFGIYFQLINLVEENAATQFRRAVENENGISANRGSWGETFKLWKEQGLDEAKMITTLSTIQVIAVLTAHPTEAKRITIIELHRELYLLLVKNENPIFSKIEKKAIRDKIINLLKRWWRTGELYIEKPDLTSERDNVVHYLSKTFPVLLKESDKKLKYSWLDMGFNPERLKNIEDYPIYNFGSWVGGDRDGHPFVTPGITQNTLLIHREKALKIILKSLLKLGSQLSLSSIIKPAPEALSEAIIKQAALLGELGLKAVNRNPYEPWRQYVNLVIIKIENTISQAKSDSKYFYRSSKELQKDLKFLRTQLFEIGAGNISEDIVFPIERLVQCFGFHLAKLDIRQNSSYYDKAISQILKKYAVKKYDFQNWDEDVRVKFLTKELESLSTLTCVTESYGKEADDVLDYFRVLRNHINLYGSEGVGSLIVSMTRNLSDLLVVYLFMKETQLLGANLRVVPLLETIEDLEKGETILNEFLSFPLTKKRQKLMSNTQEVMVGYSDSNKDGGVLASK